MDELIKRILELSEEDRKHLYKIIEQSLTNYGEGLMLNILDINKEELLEINKRFDDIKKDKNCLIEFDDHILSLK